MFLSHVYRQGRHGGEGLPMSTAGSLKNMLLPMSEKQGGSSY